MANNGIFYTSGNSLNFTTSGTTWMNLDEFGTLYVNSLSSTTFSGNVVNSITATGGVSSNSTTGNVTLTNTDRGSSQSIFKNINIDGVTKYVASSNNDSLNFSGQNITISTGTSNTLIFSGVPQLNLTGGRNIDVSGTYPNLDLNSFLGNLITVGQHGTADFERIGLAVDSITDSGPTNPYTIYVGPGVYPENGIDLTLKPNVSIVGCDIQSVIVDGEGTTNPIFELGASTELSFMTIKNGGNQGIRVRNINGFALIHKISIYDCNKGIEVVADTDQTQFFGEYVDINGTYSYAVYQQSLNSISTLVNVENIYTFPSSNSIQYFTTGSGSTFNLMVSDNLGATVANTGLQAEDNSIVRISSCSFDGFYYSLNFPNNGGYSSFDIDGISITNSAAYDLRVVHPQTRGTIQGSLSHDKIANASSEVYWSFLDSTDGELDITRKISITFADGTHTDTSTLIFQASTMGLISGGTLTSIGGLSAQTSSGFGYLEVTNTEVYKRIDWNSEPILLPANTENYIYYNDSAILSYSSTLPNVTENIILGRVVTNSTDINFIDPSPVIAEHTSNKFSTFNRTALGPVYATGSIVTQNTTPFRLNVSGGNYFFSENEFTPTGGTQINFTQYYRNGSGGWNTSATTVVNNTQFDNNTGTLSALTTSYFTKHTLYVVGSGIYEKYFLVLGQNQYSTLIATENADLPTPPTYFNDAVTPIASIYIQQGLTGITQFEDIRPVIGFKAGGVNASSLHANLLGLSSDDHTQYLLVNGGRAMAGSLDMGSNTITNSGTINGVTIQTHASRHQSGGADEIGTSTPTGSAIPYADPSGRLDAWISTATTSTLGLVKLSTAPVSAPDPIVVGQNDEGFQSSFTGASYNNSNGIITFNYVSGGTTTITPLITLTNGAGITIGGSYPNFTITATGGGGGGTSLGLVYTTGNNLNFI